MQLCSVRGGAANGCKEVLCKPGTQTPFAQQACCKKILVPPVRANGADRVSTSNPLEKLRSTRDINERCALIQQLDSGWRQAHEEYVPTATEECVIKELGLWKQTVMYLAIQTELPSLDAETQVRPAIKCLKQANLEPQDIWLLLSKRMHLFRNPVQLQRWLDFLAVLNLGTRELLNFFMRAPEELITAYTIHSASQVVKFLKEGLGIKPEHLAQRVLCIAPAVLMRSVDSDIKPTISLLTNLGVEISDIQGLICMWPGLLLADADTQLQPWVQYMQAELGCSAVQVGEIINASPHLLGTSASSIYNSKVQALHMVGITKEDLRSITSRATMWLKASSNVQELLDFLIHRAGFSKEQVRGLVLAAPGVLGLKLMDLERKWQWYEQVGATRQDVLDCPQALEAGLVSTLGPRHGFLDSIHKKRRIQQQQRAEEGLQGNQAEQLDSIPTLEERQGSIRVQLPVLVQPAEDGPWCAQMNVALGDYKDHRARFEEEYLKSMTRSSAMEFQDELKRLGVYEGE
ncbi:mTERF-domain-containing protein [Dunaliella salina]|uniref:mTERF-domain-containing protein n=1 Tax=Dunaliella salina TaxID=3046 RepID=A0ABQ7GRH8_DUNSA|nr:mTERF-domain-containing protein [Dunaliella salina]|eukprot:KAF5837182.1 mTERF-domain-containing protein [Dunaliella salina]